MITDWLGGVQKGQNIDYVIFEWSLKKLEKFYDCYIHRLKKFSKGVGVCPTLGHGFLEEVGQNTPCAPMMGEQIF